MKKQKVAILGSTGIVGQVFTWLLSDHDWFDPVCLCASKERNGKVYGNEVTWMLPYQIPEKIRNKKIETLDIARLKEQGIKIVFSALPSNVAQTIEPELRENGFWVFSNASAMRYNNDVPILIPEINPDSLKLIEKQGFPEKGFIVTNANCSVTGVSIALAALERFGITEVFLSTYQSISGAGYPGLSALDVLGNTIPYIENEEEKIPLELKKILGHSISIYPHCLRVPTLIGHLETVWVKFKMSVTEADIINAWETFSLKNTDTPSMPKSPIIYNDKNDFPQTKMSFYGDPPGMPVFTGRLRKINGMYGFVLLVNNLVRGAAGGSIENAELFLDRYKERV